MTAPHITVIGAGLAGTEVAWAAARLGARVTLYEMKPVRFSPAHSLPTMGELVCSNSLGSVAEGTAPALLKDELDRLGSVVLQAARSESVPAGRALAVDHDKFSARLTALIEAHPNITVQREEVAELPSDRPLVIATGPLTSEALANQLQSLIGDGALSFYDAIAPIVESDSINRDIAFRGSRYDAGQDDDGDYLNCPFTRDEYERFIDAVLTAERVPYHSFENLRSFEGCKPIEELADRGRETLAFGPLKPVGLTDPRTGKRPYAVLQLRRENAAGTLWGLVGCQTKMTYAEQRRVFRLVPGLENAVFARLGSLHRNTFIDSPCLLTEAQEFRAHPGIFCAGQLTGVEGYIESAASGVLAGLAAALQALGRGYSAPPVDTALGALMQYISHGPASGEFQPMNINFGLLPPLPDSPRRRKREDRRREQCSRARASFEQWMQERHLEIPAPREPAAA